MDLDRRKGLTLAAISALGLAVITTFARMTYDAGATPIALIVARAVAGVIVIWILARTLEGPIRMNRRDLGPVVIAGCGLATITFGYMSSVQLIPVGLAALIFYTFPLIILAYEAIRNREMPGPRRLLAFGGAFVGLALALGPTMQSLNPWGVLLAFVGGLGTVVFLLSLRAASAEIKPLALAAVSNTVVLPITLVGVFVIGDVRWPETNLGWWALTAAGIAFLIGVLTQTAAVRFAKPSEVALVLNIEPIASIAFAWVLIGETLTPVQLAGTGLVVAAIFLGSSRLKSA